MIEDLDNIITKVANFGSGENNGWISVDERLPEEGVLVWVMWNFDTENTYLDKFQCTPFILGCNGSIWISNLVEEYVEMRTPPTHWLPIPPLPKEKV